MQVLATFGAVTYSMMNPEFVSWQKKNIWLVIVCGIVQMCLECAIFCNKRLGRRVPINYAILAIITACQTYLTSMICAEYSASSVF